MRKRLLVLILCLAVLCGGCQQDEPSDNPSGSFQPPLTYLYDLDEYGVTLEITVGQIFEHKYDGNMGNEEYLVLNCSVKQIFCQDIFTLAAGDPVWVWVGLSECSQSEDDLRTLLSDADSLVVNGREQEEVYISVDSVDGRQWLSETGQDEIGTFFTTQFGGPATFLDVPPCVAISSYSLRNWCVLPIKDGHFYAQDMIAALEKSGCSMNIDVVQPDPSLQIYFQDGCTDQELYAGIEQMLESEMPSFPPLP